MAELSDQNELFENNLVVDTDVHISSEADEIVRKKIEWISEPHKSNLDPEVGLDKGAASYSDISWPKRINKDGTAVTEEAPEVVDIEEDIYDTLCEEGNVDYPIVNMSGRHDRLHSSDRAIQEARANNNVLLNLLDDKPDLFGLIDIFTHNPQEAANEINRVGDHEQVVGVYFPVDAPERPAGHPDHDVVFQAADDNDLSMVYHGAAASYLGRTPFLDEVESYAESRALAHPSQQMFALTTIIIQGVPVKFPDLNHVFLESGLGWVHYMMGRLNRDYGQRPSKAPLLEESPENYVRRNCWFGTGKLGQPNFEDDLVETVEMIGIDNIVFSSDYPNRGHDFSDVAELLSSFSQEERNAVLHENAIEAFGLSIDT